MNPQEIAIAASMKRNNVDRLLGKMTKAAETRKAGRGRYIHPERADLTGSGAPLHPGTNGKKVRNDKNSNEINGYDDGAI